jgi:signal transduction histidine kinase
MTIALENLDRVRNDFIANVSHELRTPMTSIGGFIDGIMDGVIPPEKHEYYLKIVISEISRLSTLVNELLDIAKMQSGNMEFHFTVFDINVDIRNCIIKLEPLINDKELQVELDLDNEQENVYGDRNSLQRVLINLIQNAIKFTPKGGTIKVYTKRLKDKVEVNVEDTGIGISKEDQAMIFERFFKSDKSRSEDKKGTGLGLSIVKKILIAHDQDIKVDSSLGKGSKFTFTVARPPKEHS